MGAVLEHRALTDPELAAAGRENLIETYLELGRSVEGAKVERAAGLWVCTAPVNLAYCNFGIVEEVQDAEALHRRIEVTARLAARVRPFRVFGLPIYPGHGLREAFATHHLRLQHSLSQRAWRPVPVEAGVDPDEALTEEDRRAVAGFMVAQFFFRQNQDLRASIVGSTAESAHRLFALRHAGAIEAAVMVSESPRSIGLYNLCVAPRRRRAGLGKGLVSFVQRLAYEKKKPVALQCETALNAWYQRRDFVEIGPADVFSLRNGSSVAKIGG